jgi:dCMP deaminase
MMPGILRDLESQTLLFLDLVMCDHCPTSKTTTPRLSVEMYAMSLALVASLRSEDPYLKVGAVALDADNRVLATGYNGLKAGSSLSDAEWADRDGRLPFILHAEVNCLALCTRGQVKTIAVTTQPCSACALNIVAHGVKKVIYGQPYHRDSTSLKIFERYGIEVQHVPIRDTARAISAAIPEGGE